MKWMTLFAPVLAMAIMDSPDHNDLRKPFFVTTLNDYVWINIFKKRQTCIGARFTPVSDDYIFFHFYDFSKNDYNFFDGTLLKIQGEQECFKMITSDRVHNNLSFCFREYDPSYYYMYVSDLTNATGFGLINSIENTTSIQKMHDIMLKHNQQPVTINIENCLLGTPP